jgi:hypothetical protein
VQAALRGRPLRLALLHAVLLLRREGRLRDDDVERGSTCDASSGALAGRNVYTQTESDGTRRPCLNIPCSGRCSRPCRSARSG